MNEHNLPPEHDDGKGSGELTPFEARLKELVPRGDRLDRDRLLFLAGRASVESEHDQAAVARALRRRSGWSAGVGSVTTAAVLLLAFFMTPAGNRPDAASHAGRNDVTRPNKSPSPSGEPSDMDAATGGVARSRPPVTSDVEVRVLPGRFRSLTARDVRRVAETGLAWSGAGVEGGRFIDLSRDELRPEPHALTPSAWQRVVDEM